MAYEEKVHQDENLLKIREGILAATPASAVYLFSLPTWNHPDYELLVVTDDPRSEDEVRIAIRRQLRESGIPMQLVVANADVFKRQKMEPNSTARDIADNAILLHG